jgi:hypothetical protein
MQWDVNYLEVEAGLDYKILAIKKASLYKKDYIIRVLVQGSNYKQHSYKFKKSRGV